MASNLFTVYSQRLAGYLMQRGFVLIKLVGNPHNSRNSFLFANTSALRNTIDEWQMRDYKQTSK